MAFVKTGVRFGVAALWRCRRGAAAAEFALIIPLLMTLIFGTIEMGAVFFSYSAMQHQASRAARAIAVNLKSTATVTTELKAQMPAWARDYVTVTVTQTAPTDPNTNLIRVRVSLPSNHASPVTILSSVAPWPLVANVTIKQELPYA